MTTGHHYPASFAAEIQKLTPHVRWIVVHRKPRFADQIAAELTALALPNVELVVPGRVYEFLSASPIGRFGFGQGDRARLRQRGEAEVDLGRGGRAVHAGFGASAR